MVEYAPMRNTCIFAYRSENLSWPGKDSQTFDFVGLGLDPCLAAGPHARMEANTFHMLLLHHILELSPYMHTAAEIYTA